MSTLRARTELNANGFNQGVGKMQNRVRTFQTQLKSMAGTMAAAFSVTIVAQAARSVMQWGSALTDLAAQSRLTTDEIQTLEVASLRAGVGTEKIRTVMSKLSVVIGQAKSGMKTYVDLFDKIGVSQSELAKMNTRQVLERVASAFTEAEAGSIAYGASLELLGTRSGAQLQEVLEDLANVGLDGMIKREKEAGTILEEEMLQRLDDLEDRLQLATRQTKVIAAEIGVGLVESLNNAGTGFGDLVGKIALFGMKSEEVKDIMRNMGREVRENPWKVFTGFIPAVLLEGIGRKVNTPDKEEEGEDDSGRERAVQSLLQKEKALAEEKKKTAAAERALAKENMDLYEQLLDVNERLGSERAKMKQLDASNLVGVEQSRQRILKLQLEELRIQNKLNAEHKRRQDITEREANQLESRKADIRERAEERKERLKLEGVGTQGVSADRLAQMGGYTTGQASPVQRVAERQLEVAKRMEKIERDMAAALQRIANDENGGLT